MASSNKVQNGDVAQSQNPASSDEKPSKELYPMSNWKYDVFLWSMSVLVDLFFREVHPRGAWKVPRSGPILFVAAPHANQVSDSHPPSTAAISTGAACHLLT